MRTSLCCAVLTVLWLTLPAKAEQTVAPPTTAGLPKAAASGSQSPKVETAQVSYTKIGIGKGTITAQLVAPGLARDRWLIVPEDAAAFPDFEAAAGRYTVIAVRIAGGDEPVQINTMSWQLIAGDTTLDKVTYVRDVPFETVPPLKTIQAGTKLVGYVVFPKLDAPVAELTMICPAGSFRFGDRSAGATSLDWIRFVLTGSNPRTLQRGDVRREKTRAETPLFAPDATQKGTGEPTGRIEITAKVGNKPCAKMGLFVADFDYRDIRDTWSEYWQNSSSSWQKEMELSAVCFSGGVKRSIESAKAVGKYKEARLDKGGTARLEPVLPGEYYLATQLRRSDTWVDGGYDEDSYNMGDLGKWTWIVRVAVEGGKMTTVVLTEANGTKRSY